MGIRQEKLEYVVTDESHEHDNTQWLDAQKARVKKGAPGREGRHGGDQESKAMNNAVFLNSLPPGMDHADAEFSDIRQQDLSRGNLGNGDQYTTDVTRDSLAHGYSKKPLSSTDAALSEKGGFYSEIEVDGKTGFLERRNVMDRN